MRLETERGAISISPDVFTNITGAAATNCYGVKGMAVRSTTDGLVHLLRRESMAKGVKVRFNDDATVSIELHIIVENGVKYVCISMGKEGALLVSGDRAWFSEGADVPVRGVQGAGDSLVSGICMAILDGVSEPEILHYGVAVAHGSLIHDGTQMCMPEDFKQMMELISVREI